MFPQVSFRLSVPVLIFFVLACAGVVALFWLVSPAHQEVVKFAAELLGGATAIYALFMNAQSARNAAARRFIERWMDPNFASFRTVLTELLEKEKPDDLHRQTLIAILNFWEEIAIAVFAHEASELLLQDFFNTMVLRTFAVTQVWINKERNTKKYPTAYIQFENLYNRWRPK
ncbi:MAG: DUF4760 domain-containing protein [Terriglobia bacterium]|jgi:hypothetical protein